MIHPCESPQSYAATTTGQSSSPTHQRLYRFHRPGCNHGVTLSVQNAVLVVLTLIFQEVLDYVPVSAEMLRTIPARAVNRPVSYLVDEGRLYRSVSRAKNTLPDCLRVSDPRTATLARGHIL